MIHTFQRVETTNQITIRWLLCIPNPHHLPIASQLEVRFLGGDAYVPRLVAASVTWPAPYWEKIIRFEQWGCIGIYWDFLIIS